MKYKMLKNIVLAIVILMGSVPSLITLVSREEGPFQISNGPYLYAVIIAAVSIFIVVVISCYLSRFLFSKWIKENHSLMKRSLLTGLIVFLSGMIAFIIGWESNWITAYFLEASNVTNLKWIQFLYTVPLFAMIYSVLPALGISIIMIILTYYLLKSGKF